MDKQKLIRLINVLVDAEIANSWKGYYEAEYLPKAEEQVVKARNKLRRYLDECCPDSGERKSKSTSSIGEVPKRKRVRRSKRTSG